MEEAHINRNLQRQRVRSACVRCKRQKLKCDDHRPCTLCSRAGIECISELGKKQRKRTRTSSIPQPVRIRSQPAQNSTSIQPQNSGPKTPAEHDEQLHGVEQTSNTFMQVRPCASPTGLTHSIVDIYDRHRDLSNETSAIPGGTTMLPFSNSEEGAPIYGLFSIDLPSHSISSHLLKAYFTKVHSILDLFQESAFRAKYEPMILSKRDPSRKKNQIILLFLVLALGAKYVDPTTVPDCIALGAKLFRVVEERLLEVWDESGIEAVQICVLLSSYYLCYGRPNRAFVILGAGVRCAQAIGLHKEHSWKNISQIERAEWARTWWVLYVFDRFSSFTFGRPYMIRELDYEVSIPKNMDDTEGHPRYRSLEDLEDGTHERVNIFSHFRYKIKLYRIATPIIDDLYVRTKYVDGKAQIIGTRLEETHKELVKWYSALPPELQYKGPIQHTGTQEAAIIDRFNIQALELQLAYDNIQILLHRSRLSVDNPLQSVAKKASQVAISRKQCWESAIRSSKIDINHKAVSDLRKTHGAAYMSVRLLTAALVLSIFALSSPLSTLAQEAKQAIARILANFNAMKRNNLLSAQGAKIIEELIRLLLKREMNGILGTDAEASLPEIRVESLQQRSATSPPPDTNIFSTIQPSVANFEDSDFLSNAPRLPKDFHSGQDASNEITLQETNLQETDLLYGIGSVQQVITDCNNWPDFDQQQSNANSTLGSFSLDCFSTGNRGTNFGDLNNYGQAWLWDQDLV
ncbi:uncharacterized protein K452DRAFT_40691 [Aplosporella prunicola CBS 121167]|uniref:Zn(2)-C6 fungal-type domain-containing protein n=1 Tax=Aplosporella prunicola CBS 121167 TaxID=1176127 RepID=A0A6A6BBC1_9PEZI|nr:uncharacterized protein K452DRAFT_40691 [Aplosporella prunicola CBS 121167]KAF2141532.1 hypothetical protein K452DRAFT_40691 [Aplosporella prunicola CBS 121167]